MRWLATGFLDHALCSIKLEVLSPVLSSYLLHHHCMGIIAHKEVLSCWSALVLVSMSYLYTGLWKPLSGTPCSDRLCFACRHRCMGFHSCASVVWKWGTWLSTNCRAAQWMQICASAIMYLVTNCSQMSLWGWMPNRVSGSCWLGFLPFPPTPLTRRSAGSVTVMQINII